MKIIFHIGMGKTGTSSIQKALQTAGDTLSAHNARYLGMWLDIVAPRYHGHEGLAAFCQSSVEVRQAGAESFLAALRERERNTGDRIFILSNEGLFGQGEALTPFVQTLRQEAEVQLVAYMRPAREWLPSAFSQWGIRHKTYPGPILPFHQHARYLIGQYDGIRAWQQSFSDILSVRLHTSSMNVVADFSEAIGIPLDTSVRHLERSEPAEMVLQALFNNRFEQPVLPDQFTRTIVDSPAINSVEEMVNRCFDYGQLDEIVAERTELFDYVRQNIGIDLATVDTDPRPVDREALRERILDYLIEINFRQALRIKKLEADVEELKR